jgi:hypothetical protein
MELSLAYTLANKHRTTINKVLAKYGKYRKTKDGEYKVLQVIVDREGKKPLDGFDFGGVYDVVNRHEAIGYTMEDGRRVDIAFVDQGNETKVI